MGENRAENEAFVSLVTNNSYANGALVLGYSLRRVNTTRKLALLVTNQVTDPMREQLSRVWDHLVTVDPLDSRDDANLALLTRPELGITFTKIRCWNLTQYSKCVFLDADMLVLQNCDELFDRQELSAVTDIGWPDCFNSGMFVFEPSRATYEALLQHAIDHGSFDGGDQGLLNSFFSNWATSDISTHLSFIYNMSSNASYTYTPAFRQFGRDVKIVHFIGPVKPWQCNYSSETGTVYMPDTAGGLPHENTYLQLWWDIYVTYVLPGMRQCSDELPHEHPTNHSNLEPDSSSPDQEINHSTPYIPEPNQFHWTPEPVQPNTEYSEPTQDNHHPVSPHTDNPDQGPIPEEPSRTEEQEPEISEEANYDSYYFSDDNIDIHQVTDEIALLHLQHDSNLPVIVEADQRTAWENGAPDYTGRDRFSNIQERLDSAVEGQEYRAIQDVPTLI
ncbi:glycogenin-1-like isoform X1 [Actinia tenebrosa]|uniref:glycogenin glucosyltransferase n=1 Tax=Actinia tenebrosa TaxID=6105 RepID=A0A6P8HJB6_ACTTE|nr:glycogenin-1-like isoform X1 [Actinia tenebrosa]